MTDDILILYEKPRGSARVFAAEVVDEDLRWNIYCTDVQLNTTDKNNGNLIHKEGSVQVRYTQLSGDSVLADAEEFQQHLHSLSDEIGI